MSNKLQYFRYVLAITSIFSVFPLIAQGFTLGGESTITTVINEVLGVISILVPILFTLAFIVFFWGLAKFILHSGSPAEIEKGKEYMFWGILALFILISVKTIIVLISTDLGLG